MWKTRRGGEGRERIREGGVVTAMDHVGALDGLRVHSEPGPSPERSTAQATAAPRTKREEAHRAQPTEAAKTETWRYSKDRDLELGGVVAMLEDVALEGPGLGLGDEQRVLGHL